MKREIKFRVMNSGQVIAYEYLNQSGWYHVLLNNNTHYAGVFIDAEYGYLERCDRDQFTGLKDKNGVDIYEGDIFGTPEQLRCVVEQEKNGAYVLRFVHPLMKEKKISILDDKVSKSRIIGNIYQNPELLK